MKILTVVGARPQFVKAAVLSRNIRKNPSVAEVIVHTGQHFDKNMSEIFFSEMEISEPNYNLSISGLDHGAMTGRMLEAIERILKSETPDYLVVYGDTNSTLAAAVAAKKLGIRTAHIEAGVRNFDEKMPEEVNRYLVDRMAELNFCCTDLGVTNLAKEGFNSGHISGKVFNCGDVMYDAALYYGDKSDKISRIIDTLSLTKNDFVLSTVHRASNTDSEASLRNIVKGLNEINEELSVVLPVHPRTRNKIEQYDLRPNFLIIDPVGYFDMLQLIKNSRFVVTDSGGLVREAYFFEKYSLLLLEHPLWPELVEGGFCLTTDPDKPGIRARFDELFRLDADFMGNSIYGDGRAGEKILDELLADFEKCRTKISVHSKIS